MPDNRHQLQDDLRVQNPQAKQQTGALPGTQPQAGHIALVKPLLEKRRLVERLIEHLKNR